MEIKNIFIALVLFAMVSVGMFGFTKDLIGSYEQYGTAPIEGNYSQTYDDFNVLADLNDTSRNIYDKLQQGDQTKADKLQFFLLAPALVWNIFTTILKLPLTILDIVGKIATTIGLPDFVITGFTVILTAVFGFLILAAIIKWKV